MGCHTHRARQQRQFERGGGAMHSGYGLASTPAWEAIDAPAVGRVDRS
jgi:hypothetical protein